MPAMRSPPELKPTACCVQYCWCPWGDVAVVGTCKHALSQGWPLPGCLRMARGVQVRKLKQAGYDLRAATGDDISEDDYAKEHNGVRL